MSFEERRNSMKKVSGYKKSKHHQVGGEEKPPEGEMTSFGYVTFDVMKSPFTVSFDSSKQFPGDKTHSKYSNFFDIMKVNIPQKFTLDLKKNNPII